MGTIVIEQIVATDPQRVWAAWTTADGLAAWWWPHLPGAAYVVDARRGGQYRIGSVQAGIGVYGTFERGDEPRQLVFSWVWITGTGEEPEDRVTVGFADLGTTRPGSWSLTRWPAAIRATTTSRAGATCWDDWVSWSEPVASLGVRRASG